MLSTCNGQDLKFSGKKVKWASRAVEYDCYPHIMFSPEIYDMVLVGSVDFFLCLIFSNCIQPLNIIHLCRVGLVKYLSNLTLDFCIIIVVSFSNSFNKLLSP